MVTMYLLVFFGQDMSKGEFSKWTLYMSSSCVYHNGAGWGITSGAKVNKLFPTWFLGGHSRDWSITLFLVILESQGEPMSKKTEVSIEKIGRSNQEENLARYYKFTSIRFKWHEYMMAELSCIMLSTYMCVCLDMKSHGRKEL